MYNSSTTTKRRNALCIFVLLAILLLAATRTVSAHQTATSASCVHNAVRSNASSGTGTSRLADVFPTFNSGIKNNVWRPIRIAFFMEPSRQYCTAEGQIRPNYYSGHTLCQEDDVLTDSRWGIVETVILPQSIQMHSDRLLVQPTDRIVMHDPALRKDTGTCSRISVPVEHQTEGVKDADFVVYVVNAPIDWDPNAIAWATTCQYDIDGRPVMGVLNVSPKGITNTSTLVRVAAHELMHALGFDGEVFSEKRMLRYMMSVREKPKVTAVTSKNVVAASRNQFGCDGLQFLEVDEGSSHWSMRVAKDELMSGYTQSGFYTGLSIAAMEDLGYYKGNYSQAEPMTWGKDQNCTFIMDKCLTNGAHAAPVFCNATLAAGQCTSDRLGIGSCDLTKHSTDLPTYAQYFMNHKLGGTVLDMDYCPTIFPSERTLCTTGVRSDMPGSQVSQAARCFSAVGNDGLRLADVETPQWAICAEVRCSPQDTSYEVRVQGSSVFTACSPGDVFSPSNDSSVFQSGLIMCPPYDEVCVGNIGSSFYDGNDGKGDGAGGYLVPSRGLSLFISFLIFQLLLF